MVWWLLWSLSAGVPLTDMMFSPYERSEGRSKMCEMCVRDDDDDGLKQHQQHTLVVLEHAMCIPLNLHCVLVFECG